MSPGVNSFQSTVARLGDQNVSTSKPDQLSTLLPSEQSSEVKVGLCSRLI